MRRFTLLSLVAAAALITMPVGAPAAIQVGQTVDPNSSNCLPDTFVQSASPGNQFAVPFDGVITSWSYLGGAVVPSPLRLKLGTVGSDTMTILGESAFETPAPNQMNTFPTRIPARAQSVLGFYFPAPNDLARCGALHQPGFRDVIAFQNDVAAGTSSGYINDKADAHLDVSAMLEPDCDKDGLGDETQDSDTSTCPPCNGQRATIVGTNRNDVLSGASGRDVIVGLGGKDRLSGLGGSDLICAGAGKDTLKGGGGKDKLFGEAGKDVLKGGRGKDKLVGGPGKDKLVGGPGKDKLVGGPGKDKQVQ